MRFVFKVMAARLGGRHVSTRTIVLGSGEGSKYLAWQMARAGRRTAVVERRWTGGSCPNINCLPSKNEIWSAKVADLALTPPGSAR